MSSIESRFLAFLRARIATMGEDASGAYNYYKFRADNDRPLLDYERTLIDLILAERPARVVHAGIGIGPLIAILSASGLQAVGYEADEPRFAAAEALRAELDLPYELRKARYPAGGDLGQGGLLLFTNVANSWDQAEEDAIVASFAHFDTVLLDLRLFGAVRGTDKERAALRRRLEAAGTVEDLPPIAGAFYVRITPVPAKPGGLAGALRRLWS